ncbi:MAG: MFS transporter [Candidatus Omnitrophica bacterium]|nr:MFS transporter [Candidatus Omnitrophota bacterium]
MSRDRWLICAAAGLRASAAALSGIILALHLATLGFGSWSIGLAISCGLAGCAAGTALVTMVADRFGRRPTLILLSGFMGLGGLMFTLSRQLPVLFLSAFVGMINGMGRDRGAGMTLEQAMLPQMAAPSQRTTVFAWYNVVVDVGHALGSLLGGLPAWLRLSLPCSRLASYQWTWGFYSVLCLGAGLLALRLSPAVELRAVKPAPRLSAASRPLVAKFAALSALDSVGGGFLTTALLSYWFFQRFGVDEALLGPLFCGARLANGLSHAGAAWLARRIGLVNTMVFTHLPSSLVLMTIPFAPNLPVAIALFLVRESFVEMDVPTRQSYLVAVVKDEERTRAAGVTNLARNISWAVAPMAAGSLMRVGLLSAPLVIGPGLKVMYDLLLYRAFRHVRPPEERPRSSQAPDGAFI